MSSSSLNLVILGLSITSSWGNGHATVFRGLVRELALRGHDVLFLERDKPWYAQNRDLPDPGYGRTALYHSVSDLKARFHEEIANADCVLVGSCVPDGLEIGHWIHEIAEGETAFYDLDTPVTLAAVESGKCDYLDRRLMQNYGLYLSFTGGPLLQRLEREFHVQRARAFYCCADPSTHFSEPAEERYDLGYLGTYTADRQPALQRLLIRPAVLWSGGRFIVAGPQFPASIAWPPNVERIAHLPPHEHRAFYNRQRFTLNLTRAEMIRTGYSPGVRLFEAAACGTPIISDLWEGLEEFFEPGREIVIARSTGEVLEILHHFPASEARAIGERAKRRVLAEHTAAHRAAELELHLAESRVPGLTR